MVKATAANGYIRAFAANTKDLVEEAKNDHNTSPVATAALGRMLTAAAMMGSMMKGEKDLLTLKIEGDGPLGGVIATANNKGEVKGYPFNPTVIIPPNAKGKLDVAEAIGVGLMSVIMDTGMKEPYVGQVALLSGEIAEDLTYYYATSEQTPSSVGLGVLLNKDNTINAAGGFIIQLMPHCPDEIIDKLEIKINNLNEELENIEKIGKIRKIEKNSYFTVFFVEKKDKGEFIGKKGKNIRKLKKILGDVVVKEI